LRRAATSIAINIAEGNAGFTEKKRVYFLNIARASALECAACLDLLSCFSLIGEPSVIGKGELSQICAMLYKLQNVDISDWQISDDECPYDEPTHFFSHEKLNVYQVSLRLATAVDSALIEHKEVGPVRQSLERSSTGIVLNIAEGNGRFGKMDRLSFLKTAYSHTLKTAAMIDVWTAQRKFPEAFLHTIKEDAGQVGAMLVGLMRSVTD
jgi:four helix bundle protein